MPVKQTYQQLIDQNIRNDAVLQSIGDGLIVIVDVDRGGKIAYVNKVFEEMTGWKLKEVLNKSIVKIVPRQDKNGKTISFSDRIITKVLAGEKVTTDLASPFYYIRKDKSSFPVASVITPIILKGKIVGAVETFRDISKESESDKAKTEFASLVSHQLRTPFATINWYVELLLAKDIGPLNQKQEDYLREVYKASKRMVALVNVLLSVSRIEMGTLDIDKKMIDITCLAETIIDEEKLSIKEKSLKISKRIAKNIPKILADPKQLTIVFQNLLSNAIKYSPKRGKISLKIEHEDKNIKITVTDSGIGIPKADRPKIFDRFFRADNAKEIEPDGVGLGLYISKAVIEMMGGKIWFKSQVKKGTVFYITIPVNQKLKITKKKPDETKK